MFKCVSHVWLFLDMYKNILKINALCFDTFGCPMAMQKANAKFRKPGPDRVPESGPKNVLFQGRNGKDLTVTGSFSSDGWLAPACYARGPRAVPKTRPRNIKLQKCGTQKWDQFWTEISRANSFVCGLGSFFSGGRNWYNVWSRFWFAN